MNNNANYGTGLGQITVSGMKEKTDQFIRQIDKNHAEEYAVQYGKHANPIEKQSTSLRKPLPSYDQEKENEEMRYRAFVRLQNRLENNELLRKETRKLTLKQTAGRIMATGLLVILGGTYAGMVAAYQGPDTLSISNEITEEDREVRNLQALRASYNEAGITPTEAEYEAGLTPQQLEEKQALDAKLAEESANAIGRAR